MVHRGAIGIIYLEPKSSSQTPKRRITTILAALTSSAGLRRSQMSRFGGKATLAPDGLPNAVIDDALGEQVKTAPRLR